MRDLYSCMVSTCYIKCSTLLIGMVGCFVHAHHDHQTEWNEDTAYELGGGREERGGVEGGREGRGSHPHTPKAQMRREGRGGEGRGGEDSPLADKVFATNCQACTVSPACGVVWRGWHSLPGRTCSEVQCCRIPQRKRCSSCLGLPCQGRAHSASHQGS